MGERVITQRQRDAILDFILATLDPGGEGFVDLSAQCPPGRMVIDVSVTEAPPDQSPVSALVVGDRFVWADRVVTLERVEREPTHRGSRHPSRWLHVRDETGKPHRLNYRDGEMVDVSPPAPDSQPEGTAVSPSVSGGVGDSLDDASDV